MKKVLKRLGAILVTMAMLLSLGSTAALASGNLDAWSGDGVTVSDTTVTVDAGKTATLTLGGSYSGSLLIEAQMQGANGATVSAGFTDETKTDGITLPESFLTEDEWTDVQLIWHMETGNWLLYSDGKYVSTAKVTVGTGKNSKYFYFAAPEAGSIAIKDVIVSRFITNISEDNMFTLVDTDFTSCETGKNLISGEITGWGNLSTSNNAAYVTETLNNETVLKISKNYTSATSTDWNVAYAEAAYTGAFKLSTELYFPEEAKEAKTAFNFTVAFTGDDGKTKKVRIARIGTGIKDDNYNNICIHSDTSEVIATAPTGKWFTLDLYVDAYSQMGYGSVTVDGETSTPVQFNFGHSTSGRTTLTDVTSFSGITFANDGSGDTKLYMKNFTLKGNYKEVLLEDDFSDSSYSDTLWQNSHSSKWVTKEYLTTGKNNEALGSQAMYIERKNIANKQADSEKKNGKVFDTNGDGFTNEYTGYSKSGVDYIYAPLNRPVKYGEENVNISYDIIYSGYVKALANSETFTETVDGKTKFIYQTNNDGSTKVDGGGYIFLGDTDNTREKIHSHFIQNTYNRFYKSGTTNNYVSIDMTTGTWKDVDIEITAAKQNYTVDEATVSNEETDSDANALERGNFVIEIDQWYGGAYYLDNVEVYTTADQIKVMDMENQYLYDVVYDASTENYVVEGIKLEGSDAVVKAIADGNVIKAVSVTRYTAPANPAVIAALYDGDLLKNVSVTTLDNTKMYQPVTATLENPITVSAGMTNPKVKVFIFNSMSSLVPMLQAPGEYTK